MPLGPGALAGELTRHVLELDWWQRLRLGPVQVTFVPAQHGHRRSALDAQRPLGGRVLSGEKTIYHAGDTGYFPGFGAIGHLLGPIDLALLPLGGYEPRWMMQPVHLNPEEAVQAWQDLGARDFLGMHFGTFDLTDEPVDHGVHALPALIGERGLDPTRFTCWLHGGPPSAGAARPSRGRAATTPSWRASRPWPPRASAPTRSSPRQPLPGRAHPPPRGPDARRTGHGLPARSASALTARCSTDAGELARRSAGLAARLLELGLQGETVLITARTNAERVLGLLASLAGRRRGRAGAGLPGPRPGSPAISRPCHRRRGRRPARPGRRAGRRGGRPAGPRPPAGRPVLTFERPPPTACRPWPPPATSPPPSSTPPAAATTPAA
ncbi:MAG: MBL fold metallo-hydrolase [bacterium]